MVERLKDAIAKARQRREQATTGTAPATTAAVAATAAAATTADGDVARLWRGLPYVELDPEQLERERIVSFQKSDPSYVTFDVLRTRILKTMRDTGWTRIAVTSPTKGCGKTVIATNLAFSISRHEDFRTMLIDMDLKAPRIAGCLGQREKRRISWFLSGDTPPENYLVRVSDTLAVGMNTERTRDSAELIESRRTAETLNNLRERYKPDITIFDLPPMLVNDDALAFLPNVDCALLVVAAGESKTREIDECEALLTENTNFLGVLLNKHIGSGQQSYYYGYY